MALLVLFGLAGSLLPASTAAADGELEGAWRSARDMTIARFSHTSTLLDGPACRTVSPPDYCGKLLVTGGSTRSPGVDGQIGQKVNELASTELYDPAEGTWASCPSETATPSSLCPGSMKNLRSRHTATLLDGPECQVAASLAPDHCGQVFVMGGPWAIETYGSGEVYDPATGTWRVTEDSSGRSFYGHTATLLDGPSCRGGSESIPGHCGTVLLVGGYESRTAASIFDPKTETWQSFATITPHAAHSATLLDGPECSRAEIAPDHCGNVLVAGGFEGQLTSYGGQSRFAELFVPDEIDPISEQMGLWIPAAPMLNGRGFHTATVLDDPRCRSGASPIPEYCGRALIVGAYGETSATTELYDPASDTWSLGARMSFGSYGHTATLLDGSPCDGPSPPVLCGHVLIANSRAQIYDPASVDPITSLRGRWVAGATMGKGRIGHAASLVDGERCRSDVAVNSCFSLLVTGGSTSMMSGSQLSLKSVEVFDPAGLGEPSETNRRPTILSVKPDSGYSYGGTSVNLTGTSLDEVYEVRFGGVPAQSFEIKSPTQIVVTSPAHLPGSVPVGVSSLTGNSIIADAFSYIAEPDLNIRAVDPPAGPTNGGTVITITGTGFDFQGAPSVVIGDRQATEVTRVSDTKISALTPPNARGVVDVTVSLGGATSPPAHFRYADGAWGSGPVVPDDLVRDINEDTLNSTRGQKRSGQTATRLDGPSCRSATPEPHCGKILAIWNHEPANGQTLEARLYDPVTGAWGDPLPVPLGGTFHSATLLDGDECHGGGPPTYCGQVLIVASPLGIGDPYSARSGLFDPDLERVTPTGSLVRGGQADHSAVLLKNGQVLVAGGRWSDGERPVDFAEVFDPVKRIWTPTASLLEPRASHSATVLEGPACDEADRPDHCGQVLIAAGVGQTLDPDATNVCNIRNVPPPDVRCSVRTLKTAELYDPDATDPGTGLRGSWSQAADLAIKRTEHAVVQLADGTVMVAGGGQFWNHIGLRPLTSTEIFDPAAGSGAEGAPIGSWSAAAQLRYPRYAHSLTQLPSGTLLAAGGWAGADPSRPGEPSRTNLSSSELFDPSDGSEWIPTSSLEAGRMAHASVLLDTPQCREPNPPSHCGTTLVVGGFTDGSNGPVAAPTVDVYTAAPTVDNVNPPARPAGDEGVVTIAGSGFDRDIRLFFGTVELDADEFEVASPTEITARPPDQAASTVEVEVRNAGGTSQAIVPNPDAQFTTGHKPVETTEGVEEPSGQLGQVTDLAASAKSARAIDLSFSAADDGNAGGADRYVIKQSAAPITASSFDGAKSLCGGVCSFAVNAPGDKVTLAVKDLKASTTYHYALKVADDPTAEMSNPASATTLADTIAPNAVTDLGATPLSGSEIKLTFSAPASDAGEGPPVTDYVIKQSREPITEANFETSKTLCEGTCRFTPAAAGEQLALSVTGLESSSTYHYALKAVDEGDNISGLSNSAFATTSEVTPGEVTGLEATPKSMSKISLGFSAADDGTGEAATSYVIKQAKRAIRSEDDFSKAQTLCGGSCRFEATEIGQSLRLAVTGLDPDTTYHYAIRALDDSGDNLGARSPSVKATTRPDRIDPGKVDDLRARALSKTAVKLAFSAVASNGSKGPAVTTYIIKQSTRPITSTSDFKKAQSLCGKVCSFDVAKVGGRLSLKITELSPATTYYYAVTAVDRGDNRGPRSNLARARTSRR